MIPLFAGFRAAIQEGCTLSGAWQFVARRQRVGPKGSRTFALGIDIDAALSKGDTCINQNACGATTAFSMISDFSAYATGDLLRMINDGGDRGEDFAYNALWGTVFKRWRKGIDLEPLIQLLQSEKSSERQRGAWYLDEAYPPADCMVDVVIKLADDPVGNCRWRFVAYVTNSGLYSDAIADRLAACLLDRDLHVRAETIFWAVVANAKTFAHFSEAVLTGAGTMLRKFRNPESTGFWRESERKRAARGIEIAQRLRAGESVASIRESMPEEDSFSFDKLASLSHVLVTQ
ncbi:hypothetical protein [Rhizobium sp. L43]|uniref:hypothetical protein n=1 Tax=Rhizobium sp. L43 TaxID=2035452 RepID=UPI000BEA3E13|nr:hypothetical protein [Rhizobium sp. L43]PDS81128.1 hypothetical protein CO667_00290 [Rhizobium sp. L43]